MLEGGYWILARLDSGCWILVDTAWSLSKSSNKYPASRIQYPASRIQPPKKKGQQNCRPLLKLKNHLNLICTVDSGKINPLYMFVLFVPTLYMVVVLR